MAGGITFQETMQGWFALSSRDPVAGEQKGRHEGTKLAMHADVKIDDLDAFIAIREHGASLSGLIDFQPLGMGLRASSGLFQLFSPGPSDDSRRMVYELAFNADGAPYYIAGEKRVRNNAGVDLWRDTTTLYTLMHRGSDKSGEVVGAGILTLGVPQLLALVSTLKPSNGGDMSTIAAFGTFFFGELWDVYAPHVRGADK